MFLQPNDETTVSQIIVLLSLTKFFLSIDRLGINLTSDF